MPNRSQYSGSLQDYLLEQRRCKRSLRDIAGDFGRFVTHADIQRVLKGIYPVDPDKRLALGLPAQVPVDVCPEHGIPHCYDCSKEVVKPKPKTRNRAYKSLYDWPVHLLRAAIENREEIRS